MPITTYTCGVCGKSFKRKKSAIKHEKQPKLVPKFQNGQRFDNPKAVAPTMSEILGIVIKSNWLGRHVVRYKIRWGQRKTTLSEVSVEKLVNEGWWTLI